MLKSPQTPSEPPGRRAFEATLVLRVFESARRPVQIAQLSALIVAGLLIRIAFIQSWGYRDDIVIFYDWFKSIGHLPLSDVYASVPGLNYPPMCVVLYKLEAIVFGWFVHGAPTESALNVAIKLPPILIDGIGAVLAYVIVRRNARHAVALLAAAFIALNPAIIYDSAYWGQNDSIPTVLALFALSQLLSGNRIVAWLAITCAILFKPPVLVLVPLMLLQPFTVPASRRRPLLVNTAFGVIAALALSELVAVTFFPHPTLLIAARHLIGQSVAFSHVFPYNSLNAFNLWALAQPFFAPDTTHLLGLSSHVWGELVFVAFAAIIYLRYLRSQEPMKIFEASTLVLLAMFLFLTEMHERYMYYAVFFCCILIFERPYRYAAMILTLTMLLNLEYGLTFMFLDDAKDTIINRFEFAPWLSHLCAGANLVAFAALLVTYVQAEPAVRLKRLEG